MLAGVVLFSACTQEPPSPPGDLEDSAPTVDTQGLVDTSETKDTGDTAETSPTNIWEDPSWWTEPGPMAPLLDFSNAPQRPHWEMWMITSPDMKTWSKPQLIAFNISSLDALVIEEGLIVSGSLLPMPEIGVEAPFNNIFSFVTTDLKTWGSHFLPIEGADATPMIIDPSIHLTPDGDLQLLYFGSSMDVDPDVPPDDYANPHHIYNALWSYDHFEQTAEEPLVKGDYVVDPTGCYWYGGHHILGTRTYMDLFYVYKAPGAETYETALQWGGVQVPFCFVDEPNNRLGLIAQYGGGYGAPMVRWCDEKPFCEDPTDLLPKENIYDGSCTSPVMAYFQEQYVLFCSSWIE